MSFAFANTATAATFELVSHCLVAAVPSSSPVDIFKWASIFYGTVLLEAYNQKGVSVKFSHPKWHLSGTRKSSFC